MNSIEENINVPQTTDHDMIQPPTAYPEPGVYDIPHIVTLLCASPGAEIHYTLDDSEPTLSSPVFDKYRLIPLEEFGQAVPVGKRTYTITAAAFKGEKSSAVKTFTYAIVPRSRDEYISEELAPGVRRILDFQNDKMYLVTGSQRALLIDTGMGSGDLRGYVESFIGDLPLDVIITHGHPDHIGRMGQFQTDYDVYMNLDDLPSAQLFIERMHFEIDLDKIKDVREGHVFDLGDRQLQVYQIPGHTKGCLVLLDHGNNILFSGDAIGSNQPTIVDALWLQRSDTGIDEYLSTLQVFRSKVAGKVKYTYGGHNVRCLLGEVYLDNLQEAAQWLVDQGVDILVPAPRPSGAWQVVSGDRLSDPNWTAINVNRDKCLAVHPDEIATLSNLQLKSATLTETFMPSVFNYTAVIAANVSHIEISPTAMSRRYAALKINGIDVKSGESIKVTLAATEAPTLITIEVVSPDRSTTGIYTLSV